jgi:hypothetical protein
MREEGIEQVLILPFTRELAMLTPEEFVEQLLVNALGARAVLVGDNFRFGHRQAGNVAVLAELGAVRLRNRDRSRRRLARARGEQQRHSRVDPRGKVSLAARCCNTRTAWRARW